MCGGGDFLDQKIVKALVTWQSNTILYINISVNYKIHLAMNLFQPYCYTLIYMLLFLTLYFFIFLGGGVAKY